MGHLINCMTDTTRVLPSLPQGTTNHSITCYIVPPRVQQYYTRRTSSRGCPTWQYIFVEEVNVNFQHLLLLLLWQQSSVEGGVHWELSTNLLEEEEVDFREHGTAPICKGFCFNCCWWLCAWPLNIMRVLISPLLGATILG